MTTTLSMDEYNKSFSELSQAHSQLNKAEKHLQEAKWFKNKEKKQVAQAKTKIEETYQKCTDQLQQLHKQRVLELFDQDATQLHKQRVLELFDQDATQLHDQRAQLSREDLTKSIKDLEESLENRWFAKTGFNHSANRERFKILDLNHQLAQIISSSTTATKEEKDLADRVIASYPQDRLNLEAEIRVFRAGLSILFSAAIIGLNKTYGIF